MVGADPDPIPTRPPTAEDVRHVCRALNAEGARYLIIGGIAVLYYGLARATEDIDLLVDPAPDNIERIKRALAILPDQAVQDLTSADVGQYSVVRIVDEITIDLISRIGDLTIETAEAKPVKLDDVVIPLASVQTLIATKQGLRERDKIDRAYLERLLRTSPGERPGQDAP
jgi:predicted nucleotidyltransferase